LKGACKGKKKIGWVSENARTLDVYTVDDVMYTCMYTEEVVEYRGTWRQSLYA